MCGSSGLGDTERDGRAGAGQEPSLGPQRGLDTWGPRSRNLEPGHTGAHCRVHTGFKTWCRKKDARDDCCSDPVLA